uniref:Uncharacterized protein n=1 Tax=Solanum tuberosum TaxID=4113 RepID=M1DFD2_SOLTU
MVWSRIMKNGDLETFRVYYPRFKGLRVKKRRRGEEEEEIEDINKSRQDHRGFSSGVIPTKDHIHIRQLLTPLAGYPAPSPYPIASPPLPYYPASPYPPQSAAYIHLTHKLQNICVNHFHYWATFILEVNTPEPILGDHIDDMFLND